jgi:acetoin utilization deacetylase AcuC-like enzyme
MLPIVFSPGYHSELPAGHRFPMGKFRLLGQRVVDLGLTGHTIEPPAASRSQLELVHSSAYLDAFIGGGIDAKAQRASGLPWSEDLVRRSILAVGGTIHTARLALAHGVACNTAGGTHHAFADRGSGYCLLNDLVVAARVLLDEGAVRKVLIVDCDVHQGDGTAAICADDDRVFTCSLHCGANFPLRKQHSDVDVDLPRGCGDRAYLATLRAVVDGLLPRVDPDLVLYDAGVDPHKDDILGHLALSDGGLFDRDRWLLNRCRQASLPVAAVIGGGYDENLPRLVDRHAILHRAAASVFLQDVDINLI